MKNIVLSLSTILLMMGGWSVFGQSKKQWQNYGDLSFAEKDYIGASVYYQRAIVYDNNDLELLWKYSNSLLLARNYIEAETQFRNLVFKDTLENFSDSKLWLGVLLKNNGKYLLAKELLSQFVLSGSINQLQKQRAANEIEGCDLALKSTDIEVEMSGIGDEVNSPFAEFASFVSGNQELVFSSQRQNETLSEEFEGLETYPVKLYKTTTDKTGKKQVNELSEVLNNAGYHVCNGSMSADGRYLYFSTCDKGFSCEIMASKYSNGVWSKPFKLNENINLPGYNSTQANICKVGDQEVMLFVSDRPGGLGKLDIWYSIKKGDTEFLEPINLGSLINSAEDDVCPWYSKLDSTLYFSSCWLPGFGGYDVFKSKGLLKKMSYPVNLGKPFNSSANDLYFSINTDGKVANLTSNRAGSKKDSLGNFNDLWQVTWKISEPEPQEISKIDSLQLVVEKAQSLLPLQLYFHNDQPIAGKNDTVSKYDYQQSYLQYLSLQNDYRSFFQENANDGSDGQIELFFEEQVKGGFEKLNQLCDLLLSSIQNGENIVLGIKGFTSSVGDKEYNILLSKRRLSALEQYFATYNNGVFLPFLNKSDGGSLTIVRLPFETKTQTNQSNGSDKIYGLESAISRKIEIYNLTLLGLD